MIRWTLCAGLTRRRDREEDFAAGIAALSRMAQSGLGACLLHAHGAGGCGCLGDGFLVMAAAIGGLVIAIRRRLALSALLLWMPLPFYVYSVAYGSVPIFIPQLWPHSYYNSRYGMEMLPALAVFAFLAVQWLEGRWSESQPLAKRLMQPIVLLLIALNTIGMMYRVPLVLKEAMVNSTTRVGF